MPQYRFGDIVEVELLDPNGKNPKRRPVRIVSTAEEIGSSAMLNVAAISSSVPDPLPPDFVELPFANPGNQHCRTGLFRRSVVKCHWLDLIHRDRILRRLEFAPGAELRQVASILARDSSQESEF